MAALWIAGVNTGGLTMEEFVAATSAHIAHILNMWPRKRAVAVSCDADLVIGDPNATRPNAR
jgi:dihydropyrimidinase